MATITITESNDFKLGLGKVQFDYLLLKTDQSKLLGEKILLSDIKNISKQDDCQDGLICFDVQLADERIFLANSTPQIYSKLTIGSDPIKRLESPPMRDGGGFKTAVKRGAQKIYNAITCGNCGSK